MIKKWSWLLWPAGAMLLGPSFMEWALEQSPGWTTGLLIASLIVPIAVGAMAWWRRSWVILAISVIMVPLSAQALWVGGAQSATWATIATSGLVAGSWWWWRPGTPTPKKKGTKKEPEKKGTKKEKK